MAAHPSSVVSTIEDCPDAARRFQEGESYIITGRGEINKAVFDWHAWAIGASGVFAISYNLFSMGLVLPTLAYIYWTNGEGFRDVMTKINVGTSAGTLAGQLWFGYLADRCGRLRLYGSSIAIVAVGAIYLAQSSTGASNSLSIAALITSWRFFIGFGTGGGLPLSAIITAGYATVHTRTRMLASVFLMQALGQLTACLLSLFLLATVGKDHIHTTSTPNAANAFVLDQIWRIVVGTGAVLAAIALILSFTKSENPQYTWENEQKPVEQPILSIASNDGGRVRIVGGKVTSFAPSINVDSNEDHRMFGLDPQASPDREMRDFLAESSHPIGKTQMRQQVSGLSLEGIKQHFLIYRDWRHLVATSTCYFVLGLSSRGLGISDSRVWNLENITTWISYATDSSDLPQRDLSIIEVLHRDTVNLVVAVLLGPMLGSIVFITIVGLIPRKKLLGLSFLGLALCLLITGGILLSPLREDFHNFRVLRVSLDVVCQIVFNIGINPLIFIIPSQIFPIRYRGTCYGITAAFGTLGVAVGEVFWPSISIVTPATSQLGVKLFVLSILFCLAAVLVFEWIPELQDRQSMEKKL